MNKFIKGRSLVIRNALPPGKFLATVTRRFVIAKGLTLMTLVVFILAPPVQAMIINVTYDSSVTSLTNAAQVETAFAAAAQTIQNLYTNAMTVNITVYFSSGVNLGQSSTALDGNPTYAELTNALRAARNSAADSNSVASLPPNDPTSGTWWIPTAEAKALGPMGVVNIDPNDPSQDGQVYFASTVSYTFDPNNRAVSGKYDFIGVAEHEITEVLGRIYDLNKSNLGGYVPYDLFRFTSSGTRSLKTNDTGVYFSVDDGVTSLKSFYPNVSLGDVQDWQSSSPPDSFDAFGSSGHELILSSADLTALDILGYNLNFPPPHLTGMRLTNGTFQINFTNTPGSGFVVLESTNISLSVSNWTVLGAPTESPAGQYQFIDSSAASTQKRFYRVSLP